MISVGEASGAIDTMLNKISEFYEKDVDATIDGATSIIEPVLMVFIGLIIGGLLITLYLPIFKIAGSMQM